MAIRADRVGVRQDQVDVHGRVTSPSFLNELLESLPEWTDMPVWVNGTEEVLPSNTSVPVTSPILADIAYPDIRRDNQYFTYRESPTPVDGLAKIKSIKGNTLVWNQQIDSSQYRTGTYSGVAVTKSTDETYLIANGTATANAYVRLFNGASFPMISGHKYLCVVPNDPDVAYYDDTSPRQYNNQYSSFVFTSNGSPIRPYARIDNGVASTNRRISFMMFDLTQMGLDITDPSDFTSLFPLSYYAYNQGSLLSFMGEQIKTTGKNLLKTNISSETINGVTFTVNKDENGELTEIIVSGTATQRANLQVLPQGTNNVLSTGRYILSCGFESQNIYMSSYNTTTGLSYRDYGSGVEVPYVTGEDYSIYISVLAGATANNIIFKPMLRLIDVEDSTFEPYTSSTLSLPISTYFPTGMKSAGTVYDELTPTKATTRIGAVDLGSLNWTYDSSIPRFTSSDVVSAVAVPSSNSNIANIKCAVYDSISLNGLAQSNKCIAVSTGGVISAKDTAYTSTSTFKSSLSGVYLYYELATPVELPTMSFE